MRSRGFLQLAEMGVHRGEALWPWAALWLQAAVYGAFAGLLPVVAAVAPAGSRAVSAARP